MNRNRALIPLGALMILSGCLVLTGCEDKAAQSKGAQRGAQAVDVVTLKAEPFTTTTDLPGRTAAYRIAEVRPQVGGIILKRHFIEGSDVQAGISLYQIDPRPHQAAYNSAKSDLARAKAAAEIARLTVERYKPLTGTNYVSKQDFDTATSALLQANSSIIAAQAAVETANINLGYTKVTSPISGRIGISSVTEGALVSTGQANAMATVQQLDPMYVDVTQSSNDYLRLKQELADGSLEQENGKAKVKLLLENGQIYPQKGTLQFSDVTVNASTGSITIRAEFPNPEGNLLPGMFVRTRLDEGIRKNALLVPQQGITRNSRGEATAMVVGADNKAEVRILTTTQAIGDKWLVTDGLKSGDRVIISGLQKIGPGVPVKAQESTSQSSAKPSSDTVKKS